MDSNVELFKEYVRIQNSAIKFAFNRFNEGLKEKEIRSLMKDKFDGIDSWFIQSAIYEAKTIYASNKTKDNPKLIFRRKALIDRCKGLISKEQYKELKLLPLVVAGESLPKGNRKFDFHIEDKYIIFKPKCGTKIKIELPNINKKLKKTLFNLQESMQLKQQAVSIKLTKNDIFITYDLNKLESNNIKSYKAISNRVLGIDMNPNFIGVSIIDSNKVIYTEQINLSQLNIQSKEASNSNYSKYLTNKRRFEVIEISKHISVLAQHYKVEKIAVEDLNIKGSDKGKGKNFNRLCNNIWLRNAFRNNLRKRALMTGIQFVEVNAAYSSTIGNINYGIDKVIPDAVASSIEIARRGRIKYIKGSSIYPIKKNEENLNSRWKDCLDWSSLDWKDIHKMFKDSGLRYRALSDILSPQLKHRKKKWFVSIYKSLDLFVCS